MILTTTDTTQNPAPDMDWAAFYQRHTALQQDDAAAEEALIAAHRQRDDAAKALRRCMFEALVALFTLPEAPDLVALPLGRGGWQKATEQPPIQNPDDWQHRGRAELPLDGMTDALDEMLRVMLARSDSPPPPDVLRTVILKKLFHPNIFNYGEGGFILVKKAKALEEGYPNPYLKAVDGNVPFLRAYSSEIGGGWGVFFPENRPERRNIGDTVWLDKRRFHHGWVFERRDGAMARAVELVRLVETTPPDQDIPIPEDGLELAGLPLAHLFSNTAMVTQAT